MPLVYPSPIDRDELYLEEWEIDDEYEINPEWEDELDEMIENHFHTTKLVNWNPDS